MYSSALVMMLLLTSFNSVASAADVNKVAKRKEPINEGDRFTLPETTIPARTSVVDNKPRFNLIKEIQIKNGTCQLKAVQSTELNRSLLIPSGSWTVKGGGDSAFWYPEESPSKIHRDVYLDNRNGAGNQSAAIELVPEPGKPHGNLILGFTDKKGARPFRSNYASEILTCLQEFGFSSEQSEKALGDKRNSVR